MTFLRIIFLLIFVFDLECEHIMASVLHEMQSTDGKLIFTKIEMPQWVIDPIYEDNYNVSLVRTELCDVAAVDDQGVETLDRLVNQLNGFEEFRDDLLSLEGVGDKVEDLDIILVGAQLRLLELGDLNVHSVCTELISPSVINESAYNEILSYDSESLTTEQLRKVGLYIRVLQLCKVGSDKDRSKWGIELKDIWDEIHTSIPSGNYLSWAIAKSLR